MGQHQQTCLGFDAAFIDCEHGGAGIERVEEMARAARLAGLASILRPESSIPWLVTRYLHRGIDGIMVPLVHDADAARGIVETVRYAYPRDYQDRFVAVMIESVEGIRNLPEMLRVSGIDVYFIGPGDLSQSMGYPPEVFEGQERPEEVVEAIDRAIADVIRAGKVAGTLVNRADVKDFLRKGVRFLYDHANHYLARGAQEFVELVNRA